MQTSPLALKDICTVQNQSPQLVDHFNSAKLSRLFFNLGGPANDSEERFYAVLSKD